MMMMMMIREHVLFIFLFQLLLQLDSYCVQVFCLFEQKILLFDLAQVVILSPFRPALPMFPLNILWILSIRGHYLGEPHNRLEVK
jgi:hypothetical protein